jgi:hypothetical protein
MKRYWVLSLLVIVLLALPLMAACGDDETDTTTTAAVTTTASSTDTTAESPGNDGCDNSYYLSVSLSLSTWVCTFALTGAYAEDCAAISGRFSGLRRVL